MLCARPRTPPGADTAQFSDAEVEALLPRAEAGASGDATARAVSAAVAAGDCMRAFTALQSARRNSEELLQAVLRAARRGMTLPVNAYLTSEVSTASDLLRCFGALAACGGAACDDLASGLMDAMSAADAWSCLHMAVDADNCALVAHYARHCRGRSVSLEAVFRAALRRGALASVCSVARLAPPGAADDEEDWRGHFRAPIVRLPRLRALAQRFGAAFVMAMLRDCNARAITPEAVMLRRPA